MLVLAGCAAPDERPLTIEYATEAILAPSCGNAQCHSSFREQEEIVLDTVEAARRQVLRDTPRPSLSTDAAGNVVIAKNPDEALLIDVLTRAVDRMPYDQPLPDNDIDYLIRYVAMGTPGAQCVPDQGNTCVDHLVMTCKPDWNLGEVVEDCSRRGMTCGGDGECISRSGS